MCDLMKEIVQILSRLGGFILFFACFLTEIISASGQSLYVLV